MKKYNTLKYLILFNSLYLFFFLIINQHDFRYISSILSTIFNIIFSLYFIKTGNEESSSTVTSIKIGISFYIITAATIALSFLYISLNHSPAIFSGILCLLWVYQFVNFSIIAGKNYFSINYLFNRNSNIAIVGDKETLKHVTPIISKQKNVSYIGYSDNTVNNYSTKHTYEDGASIVNANIDSFIESSANKKISELFITSSYYQNNAGSFDFEQLNHNAAGKAIRLRIIGNEAIGQTAFKHLYIVEGLPVLSYYKEPLSKSINRITKRAFDLFVSAFVIILVLSWLIPLVAILVKLESKGSVFFRQQRSGKDNKPFWCLKFRSMTPNKESDRKQATRNDTRITKVGAFLRKTSLDEFPQFINVFLGDMSITGPRPHMLQHTEEYSRLIKEYMVRLYAKPGITGWAQVNGYRGETTQLKQMQKRVDYDIWYIENWKFLIDIKIITRTFLFLFKKNTDVF